MRGNRLQACGVGITTGDSGGRELVTIADNRIVGTGAEAIRQGG